ncbi:MAG: hypothetical protein U1F43_08515 [Myxococcota bacterium]
MADTPGQLDPLPEDRGETSTAWRLLTSPGVFLGLTAVLAVVLAWAQTVPQRPASGELAAFAPFAEAEALAGLGLDDIWTSWVVLLLVLLLALVGAGMLLARRDHAGPVRGPFTLTIEGQTATSLDGLRGRVADALGGGRVSVRLGPGLLTARRGFEPEAVGVLVLGVVALLASVFIGRSNGFEARFTLVPGQVDDPAAVSVRDGDIFLPRALPLDLRCQRPDPMDPLRREPCILESGDGKQREELVVQPGESTSTSYGTLTPLRERPHDFEGGRPVELVVHRPSGPERVTLAPGQPTDLQATGDRLTAFMSPDGPAVVWARAGQAPVLLAPPSSAAASGVPFLEAVLPTEQIMTLTRAPESILTILGLAFIALALLVLALVPNVSLTLETVGAATRVRIRTSNRPTLAERARQRLLGGAS